MDRSIVRLRGGVDLVCIALLREEEDVKTEVEDIVVFIWKADGGSCSLS